MGKFPGDLCAADAGRDWDAAKGAPQPHPSPLHVDKRLHICNFAPCAVGGSVMRGCATQGSRQLPPCRGAASKFRTPSVARGALPCGCLQCIWLWGVCDTSMSCLLTCPLRRCMPPCALRCHWLTGSRPPRFAVPPPVCAARVSCATTDALSVGPRRATTRATV